MTAGTLRQKGIATWDDRVLANAVFFPTVCLMLQTTLYALLGTRGAIHLAVLGLSAAAMVLAVPVWFRRGITKAMVPYLVAAAVYALQYLIFVENRAYLTKYLFDLLCMVFPAYICVVYTTRWGALINAAEKAGIAIVALGLIYSLVTLLGVSKTKAAYSMSFSYYQLLPGVIFLYKFFKEKRVKHLVIALLAMGMAVAFGARGPLAAWGVFLLAGVYLSKVKTVYKVMWTLAVICGAVFFVPIMGAAAALLERLGIGSRTVAMLAGGNFFTHTGGREVLYAKCLEQVALHPLFGGGIGSDLRLINGYPHNLFVELLLHHGIPVGGAASLLLLYVMGRAFIKTEDKLMWFMLFCYGFVPQMVSNTYLSSAALWIFIGYCVKVAICKSGKVGTAEQTVLLSQNFIKT